jgi:hypothetical protein
MTIKRDPATRDWVLTCDSCKADERFPSSTAFAAIVRWINKQCWKARQLYERWRHYCPTCEDALRCHKLDQRVDRDRLHA